MSILTASEPLPEAIGGSPERFPCSSTQERCWFLNQLNPGNPALNVAVRWHVRGDVATEALEAGFRSAIARHEILRTRFVEVDGQPFQEVMSRAAFSLFEVDLRAIARDTQAKRVDEIALAEAGKPFDLEAGSLIRATLIRLEKGRAILAFVVHQICFDGWSIRVLGREVGLAAQAFAAGRPDAAALPELELQYADYALWQREFYASDAFGEQLAYWRDRLADAPYFEIAPDFPRPLRRTSSCDSVFADMPVEFGRRVEAAAKARQTSTFALGAGVLSALLARLAGTTEVMFGTQVAGRNDVDLEDLIGVFINNVVLRFSVDPAATAADHLKRAADAVRGALANQSVPFNKLVGMLNPARDQSRTPLISINFILQQAFMETARYGRFELSSAPSHAPGAIYDLNFQIVGRASGWRMTIEYKDDLFSRDTIETLLADWRNAFTAVLDAPDRPLAELPLPAQRVAEADADVAGSAEVEGALRAHPLVGDAVAMRFSDTAGSAGVYAFVTPSLRADLPLETLPEILLADLRAADERAQSVAGISVLRALPTDAAGRVARSLLPPPPPLAGGRARPAASPTSDDTIRSVERALCGIWRDVLGVDQVLPGSDFFSLGGHSLLTVRMLAEVDRVFGFRPGLGGFYRAPTVRALAEEIAAQTATVAAVDPRPADWQLIDIVPAGRGITLVGINNVEILSAIAAGEAGDRRIASVRFYDPGRDHGLTGLTLEEIAERYVAVIERAAPSGPMVLFGECMHGVLGYEIARKLRERGREIPLLASVNMWHPEYGRRLDWLQRWQVRLRAVRDNFGRVRAGQKTFIQFLGNYTLPHKLGVFRALKALRIIRTIPPFITTSEQQDFLLTLAGARNGYVPAPSGGAVLQMLTPDSPWGRRYDPTLGWAGIWTGAVEVVQVRPFRTSEAQHPGRPAIEATLCRALLDVDAAAASEAMSA